MVEPLDFISLGTTGAAPVKVFNIVISRVNTSLKFVKSVVAGTKKWNLAVTKSGAHIAAVQL
jgi:hypothetical protein